MLTLITSPICAYLRLLPPSTLMHITCRAPVLSATSSIVCIWIIANLQLNPPGGAWKPRASAPPTSGFPGGGQSWNRSGRPPAGGDDPPLRGGIQNYGRDRKSV